MILWAWAFAAAAPASIPRAHRETGSAATASEAQRRTVYRYDAAGKKEVTINALNESTVTTKDALGRPVLVEIKDDSSATVSQTSYRYRADHHGTIVTSGSGTGSVWSYIFTDNENRQKRGHVRKGVSPCR